METIHFGGRSQSSVLLVYCICAVLLDFIGPTKVEADGCLLLKAGNWMTGAGVTSDKEQDREGKVDKCWDMVKVWVRGQRRPLCDFFWEAWRTCNHCSGAMGPSCCL